MPGPISACRRGGDVCTRRHGDSHGSEPVCDSVRHAGCHDRRAIRDRRLCVRSACGKRALRDGTVDRRLVVCHFKRPAAGDLERSVNVYTDSHSDGSGVCADFRDRFIVEAQY